MPDPIRLYLDEDAMRTSLVKALRARQVDVTTALEANLMGQPDEANLAYAIAHKRAHLTFNRGDFVQLHTHRIKGNCHATNCHKYHWTAPIHSS